MADRSRFSRQIVLPEIGEAGQERIARATARVPSSGLAGEVARTYAERAGFGDVTDGEAALVPDFVVTAEARDVVAGALAALREIRRAIGRE